MIEMRFYVRVNRKDGTQYRLGPGTEESARRLAITLQGLPGFVEGCTVDVEEEDRSDPAA